VKNNYKLKENLKNITEENNQNLMEIEKLKIELDMMNNKNNNFLKDKEHLLSKCKSLNEDNEKLNKKIKKLNEENEKLKKKNKKNKF
jgi:hypothetical protein